MCLLIVAAGGAAVVTRAQQPPPTPPTRPGTMPAEQAATIAHGWAMLAQGNVAEATARAMHVLNVDPRNLGALLLAIEAQFLRAGAAAGLDEYERWLQQRPLEEPGILRRIARAVLREEANQRQDARARGDAIRALAEDRDTAVLTELAGTEGESPSVRILAEAGDAKAISTLVSQIKSGIADPALALPSLARSGSNQAIAPIVAHLNHQRPEVRGAAAEALGLAGARGETARLQALLKDPSGFVQVKAAAALLELGDESGAPLLRALLQEESAASRLVAAEALASRADPTWLAVVRGLTEAAEPEIQVGAARLLVPHDMERARTVLERLSAHENLAIRELATAARPLAAGRDLSALRHLMRAADRLTRVGAAGQVLAVTR